MPAVRKWSMGALCMIAVVLSVFGCENQKGADETKLDLGNLAEQYWTHRLMDLDYESSYDMELQQDSIPFSDYLLKVKNAGQIKVLSVKADEVEIENGKGVVTLTATCRVPSVPKELELPIKDIWIKTGKEWKHRLPEK